MLVCRAGRRRLSQRVLRNFISRLCEALKLAEQSFDVTLVGDRAIQRLNARFRGKDAATDVLSFPQLEPSAQGLRAGRSTGLSARAGRAGGEDEHAFLGDVVISVAAAARNARREGWPLQTELCQLVLHGVLHLLGYDHETDQGRMVRRELALRRRLGILGESGDAPGSAAGITALVTAARRAPGRPDHRGKR